MARARVSTSQCCSVCGISPCRTMEVEGTALEDIPRDRHYEGDAYRGSTRARREGVRCPCRFRGNEDRRDRRQAPHHPRIVRARREHARPGRGKLNSGDLSRLADPRRLIRIHHRTTESYPSRRGNTPRVSFSTPGMRDSNRLSDRLICGQRRSYVRRRNALSAPRPPRSASNGNLGRGLPNSQAIAPTNPAPMQNHAPSASRRCVRGVIMTGLREKG